MPIPAETTPPPAATEFDPLEFWIRHKSKIMLYAALLIVALLSWSIFEYSKRSAQAAAGQAFANAKTADDFRKVIEQHSGSIPAGNAHLMLAQQLLSENKHDEATATLRQFTERFPEHPLFPGSWVALGVSLEAQGKPDEALASYQKVSTGFPNSYGAYAALLAQGRIFKDKGRTDDAKRALESVVSQAPQSGFAQEATRQLQQLKAAPAPAPTTTPAAPGEAPATSPVPAETPAAATPVPAAPAPENPPAAASPTPAAPDPAASSTPERTPAVTPDGIPAPVLESAPPAVPKASE